MSSVLIFHKVLLLYVNYKTALFYKTVEYKNFIRSYLSFGFDKQFKAFFIDKYHC